MFKKLGLEILLCYSTTDLRKGIRSQSSDHS